MDDRYGIINVGKELIDVECDAEGAPMSSEGANLIGAGNRDSHGDIWCKTAQKSVMRASQRWTAPIATSPSEKFWFRVTNNLPSKRLEEQEQI